MTKSEFNKLKANVIKELGSPKGDRFNPETLNEAGKRIQKLGRLFLQSEYNRAYWTLVTLVFTNMTDLRNITSLQALYKYSGRVLKLEKKNNA